MKTSLQLIEAYVEGDGQALYTLFFERGYYMLCFNKARSRVHDDHEAPTVAEDVYMDLQEKAVEQRRAFFEEGGRAERSFQNYVLSMTGNKVIDLHRRRQRRPPTDPLGPATPDPPDKGPDPILEHLDQLDTCIENMKANEAANPKEAARKPLDTEFLEVWLQTGTYDNQPLRERFDMDDRRVTTTKQRITRRLRRCFGIG